MRAKSTPTYDPCAPPLEEHQLPRQNPLSVCGDSTEVERVGGRRGAEWGMGEAGDEMDKNNHKAKEIQKMNVRRNYFTGLTLSGSALHEGAKVYIVASRTEALLALPTCWIRGPTCGCVAPSG